MVSFIKLPTGILLKAGIPAEVKKVVLWNKIWARFLSNTGELCRNTTA